MRIQIISDLHQEFGISNINFENADLIIFAGDTNLGTKGIEWIKKRIPNKPVIHILGNTNIIKAPIQRHFIKLQRRQKAQI